MNMIEGLHKEMDRVREIITVYEETAGQAGAFAIGMMRHSIKSAEQAIAGSDTIAMITAHEDLKGYTL
jgi:hypothetical protein